MLGKENHEAGECLLKDLEVMVAGESHFLSDPVVPLKAGGASLKMGLVVTMEEGAWGPGGDRAQ